MLALPCGRLLVPIPQAALPQPDVIGLLEMSWPHPRRALRRSHRPSHRRLPPRPPPPPPTAPPRRPRPPHPGADHHPNPERHRLALRPICSGLRAGMSGVVAGHGRDWDGGRSAPSSSPADTRRLALLADYSWQPAPSSPTQPGTPRSMTVSLPPQPDADDRTGVGGFLTLTCQGICPLIPRIP